MDFLLFFLNQDPVCHSLSHSVLAMRGASSEPPPKESHLDSRNQPHYYRFTRQPVKYHRHHNPAARFASTGRVVRQPAAAAAREDPGSADSSRSSSPEPGTEILSQGSAVQNEQTCVLTDAPASVPPSPREVVQYMLGLDSPCTSAAAAASPRSSGLLPRKVMDEQAQWSMTLPNVRQSVGQSHGSSTRTLPAEQHLTSPSQKILSGLKLRRSHSGKDEQLFV